MGDGCCWPPGACGATGPPEGGAEAWGGAGDGRPPPGTGGASCTGLKAEGPRPGWLMLGAADWGSMGIMGPDWEGGMWGGLCGGPMPLCRDLIPTPFMWPKCIASAMVFSFIPSMV
ncbi:hypothetical protein EYF80_049923 [Liparis tanakae]|uniref:Uncharacterized protein n=1 Tax=Liparis tanakae TaxID=230148 RepID=A0A4Z2FFH4_9TELE|nr:hypothetical protein EYF80_049923 [Liparis tanakae]